MASLGVAISFSSWGFLLLGSPMLVAYGISVQAPTAFYGIFFLYLISFVISLGFILFFVHNRRKVRIPEPDGS